MRKLADLKGPNVLSLILLLGGVMLLVVIATQVASGEPEPRGSQQLPVSSSPVATRTPPVNILSMYSSEGKVIAEGTNDQPVGSLKLKTYRLEEVTLPAPVNVTTFDGQKLQVQKAWRLVISGKFGVGALPYFVWLDDNVISMGVVSPDLSALTAITFDSSVLRDGATIRVSYGKSTDRRMDLPEPLSLPTVP